MWYDVGINGRDGWDEEFVARRIRSTRDFMKFEYKVVTLPIKFKMLGQVPTPEPDTQEELLNAYGQDGWELVDVVSVSGGGVGTYFLKAYLKRKITR